MGPAGTVVNDPIYGNPILRVTDGKTYPAYPGEGCVTPAAAMTNSWNTDSTRFFVYCHGMMVFVYNFDGENMRATRINPTNWGPGGLYIDMNSPNWSYHNRDLIYGPGGGVKHSGSNVWEYNFKTNSYTSVFDIRSTVPPFSGGIGGSSLSANDKMTIQFDGMQDTYHYVLWLDLATKAYKVLDTKAGTINGRKVSFDGQATPFGTHLVNIDRSGRYVVISKGNNQTGPNVLIWDTVTDTLKHMAPATGGHYAPGYGRMVNANGWWPDYANWILRSLGNMTKLTKLVPDIVNGAYGDRDDHSSWNNARPDTPEPVIVSMTLYAGSTQPRGPWDDEIFAISTDPSRQVIWHLGHSFAYFDGSNFWDLPRGNVSQDGRYFMFTSNWRKKLDTTRDVFIIKLPLSKAAQAPEPTPPPAVMTDTATQVTSNANPAASGQAVTLTAEVNPPDATGNVAFFDGGTQIGSAALSVGSASITVSNLSPGSHSITASYAGTAGFSGSASSVLTEVVQPPAGSTTSIALSSSLDPTQVGQNFTLTATVTPPAATGTVQFFNGSASIGTAPLNGGSASITVGNLQAGTATFTASYSGVGIYRASSSPALTHTVLPPAPVATTTTITTSLNPAAAGQPVTLTATVSPAGATGTVKFLDSTTTIGTATLNGGIASVTTSTLQGGIHPLSASYTGDETNSASTSDPIAEQITGTLAYNPGMVVNGGFENGVQGWTGLDLAGRSVDTSTAYGGSRSALLTPNTSISQQIRVYSGVAYTLGVFVRSNGLTPVASIEWLNSAGDVLLTTKLPAATAMGAWQFISAGGYGPVGVNNARIVLAVSGASGEAWFDNVSFSK
jgi:hypothetical protein